MTHHHLRFHLPHGLQRDADDNQDGRTAQRNVGSGNCGEHNGEYRDDAQEDSAHQRDLGNDPGDEVRGRLSGTNTGDAAVVLPKVVGDLNGIVLNRHVEVVERHDEEQVQNGVDPAVGFEQAEELIPEAAGLNIHIGPDHVRDGKEGHGEDDGHNAGHVDLDRNVAVLAAVHLPAHHPFGVGDRDPALRIGHENDERDHGDKDQDNEGNQEIVHGLAGTQLPPGNQLHESRRTAGKDTGEQDNGDAVADALLSDSVTQPDDYRRTGCKDRNDDDGCKYAGEAGGVFQNAVGPAHHEVEAHRLGNRQTKGGIPGDFLNDLLAFCAFLRQPLQGRNSDGQQLNDNGCVNVRRNGHGENVGLLQAAAGHDVQVA